MAGTVRSVWRTAVVVFSLIVRQFNSISNFAAVVSRLSSLLEAIEKSHLTELATIETVKRDGPLTYEGLTLNSPGSELSLIKELSVSIPFGVNVLVDGATHAPGAALFRATAGMPTRERDASIVLLTSCFYPSDPICHRVLCGRCSSIQKRKARLSPMIRLSECSTRLVLNGYSIRSAGWM